MRFFMTNGSGNPNQVSDAGKGTRRGLAILGAAAIAGLIAGTVAVYVRGSGDGNGAGPQALVDCAGALKAATAAAPLAHGEIAAFRPVTAADPVGDLAFTSPDGTPTSLAAFAGKTVLVNLWATWCVPCRAEMPALDRLEAAMGGDAFGVVAVNVDQNNPERARAFLDEIGVKRLAFYADPSFRIVGALKKRGLAFGLPTTILVDAKGCRIGGVEGPAEWDSEEAKALLKAAIASS
jgi:thiol-disulfide isomerase/thioredoxin